MNLAWRSHTRDLGQEWIRASFQTEKDLNRKVVHCTYGIYNRGSENNRGKESFLDRLDGHNRHSTPLLSFDAFRLPSIPYIQLLSIITQILASWDLNRPPSASLPPFLHLLVLETHFLLFFLSGLSVGLSPSAY